MQCEICGTEIKGQAVDVTIDGSQLKVCSKCSQYGTAVKARSPVSRKISPVSPQTRMSGPKKTGQRRDPFAELNDELVDEYDKIIRDAREKRGWSQEVLATKVKEKASLIKKIERAEIIPEDSVRKKIERTLNIHLTERLGEGEWNADRLNKGTTLGDIVTIKRK
ncbi:multiprotein bridging factor aMBF1 [Methanococcoides sp. NM1]|uniref:multiprotein bridging factor aMBF1 n=1 Tax=Methanococcoides sp. NM1 TaxID=1201013 RepID=UPI0010825D20|nr:multiprotein bridging factor aMBF1 [Methanococcoides sp. NM1]